MNWTKALSNDLFSEALYGFSWSIHNVIILTCPVIFGYVIYAALFGCIFFVLDCGSETVALGQLYLMSKW